ncbi:hypothetical protein B0H21DRAFT_340221 [Amylocystis lapponica]|nr:hypothetical protein B0H21DRAFT_340221 [Amylocystis lapponica]
MVRRQPDAAAGGQGQGCRERACGRLCRRPGGSAGHRGGARGNGRFVERRCDAQRRGRYGGGNAHGACGPCAPPAAHPAQPTSTRALVLSSRVIWTGPWASGCTCCICVVFCILFICQLLEAPTYLMFDTLSHINIISRARSTRHNLDLLPFHHTVSLCWNDSFSTQPEMSTAVGRTGSRTALRTDVEEEQALRCPELAFRILARPGAHYENPSGRPVG